MAGEKAKSKASEALDTLLDKLVAHVAHGEGATATELRDALARYKGEQTNEEKIAAARAEEDATSEAGKAANAAQAAKEAGNEDETPEDDS